MNVCLWIEAQLLHVTLLNRARPPLPPVRFLLSYLVRLSLMDLLPSTVTDEVPIDRPALMIDNLEWDVACDECRSERVCVYLL